MLTTFVGRFTARTGEIAHRPGACSLFTLVRLGGHRPALRHAAGAGVARRPRQRAEAGQQRQAGEGGGRRRMQGALIVAQVAVSVVLLVGAGLLLASFYRLQQVDPGYRADRVMSAEVFTNFSRYPQRRRASCRFYLPLSSGSKGEPGVVSVAVTNAVPLARGAAGQPPFQIEGRVDGRSGRAADRRRRASSARVSSRRLACRWCAAGRSPTPTPRTRRGSS